MIDHKTKKALMGLFDVMFIMVLCFATLLTTMLMQGGILVGTGGSGMHYTFDLLSFSMVVLGFALYLYYIIPCSDKELREMVVMHYGEAEKESA